ncbi:hypothetical protein [Polaribacter sp. R77954]|uniref:hypothetical protein n=1 Tax=Polaribacter sp. R77954 TaxID=3093870 RepID=UPI0037C6D744
MSKKKSKLLSKIITYYQIETINFDKTAFKEKSKNTFKILYIKNLNNISTSYFSKLNSKHIIIIDDINATKKHQLKWSKIIQDNKVIVTINLFYFGLLFFRKEQAKENFKIRV